MPWCVCGSRRTTVELALPSLCEWVFPLLRYKVLPSLFVGRQDDFSRRITSQMIDKGLVHVTPQYLKSHSDTRVRLQCPIQANEYS